MVTLLRMLFMFGICFYIIEISQQHCVQLNYARLLGPGNSSTVTINVQLNVSQNTPVLFTAQVYNKINKELLANISSISEAIILPLTNRSNRDVLFRFIANITDCQSSFYDLSFIGRENFTMEERCEVGGSVCVTISATFVILPVANNRICICPTIENRFHATQCLSKSKFEPNLITIDNSRICFQNLSFSHNNSFIQFFEEVETARTLVSRTRIVISSNGTSMTTDTPSMPTEIVSSGEEIIMSDISTTSNSIRNQGTFQLVVNTCVFYSYLYLYLYLYLW